MYRIDSLRDVYFDYTDAYLKNPNLSKEDILRFRFIRDTQEIRYAWFISDTFTIDLKKTGLSGRLQMICCKRKKLILSQPDA